MSPLFLRALSWWLVTTVLTAAEGAGLEGPRQTPVTAPAAQGQTQPLALEVVQAGRQAAVLHTVQTVGSRGQHLGQSLWVQPVGC